MITNKALIVANTKLQSDKKALEKKVADLEEEITVRCRNYMNIIEGLKRGEGVAVNQIVHQEHSRRFLTLNKSLQLRVEGAQNGLYRSAYHPNKEEENDQIDEVIFASERKPKIINDDFNTPTARSGQGNEDKAQQSEKLLNKVIGQLNCAIKELQQKLQMSVQQEEMLLLNIKELKQRNQQLGQHNIQLENQRRHWEGERQLMKKQSIQKSQQINKLGSTTLQDEERRDLFRRNQQLLKQNSKLTTELQNAQRQNQSLHNINNKLTKDLQSFSKAQAQIQVYNRNSIQRQVQITQLKEQLKKMQSEAQVLVKYKALSNQLLNYKPTSFSSIKQYQKTKSQFEHLSPTNQCYMKVHHHLEILLKKMQYFQTIIHGIDGRPQVIKYKYNQQPLLKDLQELKTHIQESQSELNQCKIKFKTLLADKAALAQECSTLKSQLKTNTEQLTPHNARTPTKSEVVAARQPQSSHSSKDSQRVSVPMAKHHMIMLNKGEGCKQCKNIKYFMNQQIETLMTSHSKQITQLINKHNQEMRAKEDIIRDLNQKITNTQEQITCLKTDPPKNIKMLTEGNVEPTTVGYVQRELSVDDEDQSFVKRSYVRTKRMKQTVSVHKYTISKTREQIKESLCKKMQTINSKINQLRSKSPGRHDQEIDDLEAVNKKLGKLNKKYDNEDNRISQRSSESSQCQQSSTQVIEVVLETPCHTNSQLRVVESRKYLPGESELRANRFDFTKKKN